MQSMTTGGLSRRGLLRAGGAGFAGLTAAALLGCGGGKKAGNAPPTSNADDAATSGGPKGVKRADGFDPKLGEVVVNNKKVVTGGKFTRSDTDTSRENDPDVSIAGADWETVGDRLFYANGWNMKVTPDMLTGYEILDKQGLQMVFHLRPGIKTHNRAPVNGRIFTAKDVAYNIMRKAGKIDAKAASKYARVSQFFGLEKAEAVDDVTIKLTFSRPNGSILQALSDPRASMIPVEQDTISRIRRSSSAPARSSTVSTRTARDRCSRPSRTTTASGTKVPAPATTRTKRSSSRTGHPHSRHTSATRSASSPAFNRKKRGS
jgi:ABC-type transport system substrate-binding protein